MVAAACIMSGLYWDISWHETIGRDTFWTPAHLLVQFGAVLAGFFSSVLIFGTTFRRNAAAKDVSVRVLGFRGPLGAFICAWGGAAMISSAPFDNWWHNAYGLDVKIISPPHSLLAIGISAIAWGSVILILGQMNRAEGSLRRHLQWMILATGGFVVIQDMMFKLEYTNRVLMHSAVFYLANSIWLPFVLEGIARASELRWARTAMTGIYTVFFLLTLWIFPLFAAEPKLGPVYQPVSHMVPLHFPVLIIFPALALDLLMPRMQQWNKWLQATVAGSAFVVVLFAVQWPFGTFLMTPAARGWMFGTQQFAYFLPPTIASVRNVFFDWEQTAFHFWRNVALAFVAAILSVRLGMMWGAWMHKVKR